MLAEFDNLRGQTKFPTLDKSSFELKASLQPVLEKLCQPKGWTLEVLAQELNFSLRHDKGKYKYPPFVNFTRLAIDYDSTGIRFSIGITATPADPYQMIPTEDFWTVFCQDDCLDADVNSLTLAKKTGGSSIITAYAGFKLSPDSLELDHVQANIIPNKYRSNAAAKMVDLKEETPRAGRIESRKNALEAHGTPWAYADRMLLFGHVAEWLRVKVNAPILILPGFTEARSIYHRISKALMKNC